MKSAWEFAEDVTVTQLSLAARTRKFWLTCFWMLLFLVGVAFSIYQIVELLQMFFNYPKSTQVVVSYHGTPKKENFHCLCKFDYMNRSG